MQLPASDQLIDAISHLPGGLHSILAALVAVGTALFVLWSMWLPLDHHSLQATPENGDPEEPLQLYVLPHLEQTASSASAYCTTLETLCLMGKVPYQKHVVTYPVLKRKNPGQIPGYIEHSGQRLGDIHLVERYLLNTFQGTLTGLHAPAPDHPSFATYIAFYRMVDCHLAYGMVYYKWVDEQGCATMSAAFHRSAPFILRPLVALFLQRLRLQQKQRLIMQGVAKLSKVDMDTLLSEDLEALSLQLGDQTYLFGDAPTPLDALLFGLLDVLLYEGMETHLKRMIDTHPNLRRYCNNIRKAYYALPEED